MSPRRSSPNFVSVAFLRTLKPELLQLLLAPYHGSFEKLGVSGSVSAGTWQEDMERIGRTIIDGGDDEALSRLAQEICDLECLSENEPLYGDRLHEIEVGAGLADNANLTLSNETSADRLLRMWLMPEVRNKLLEILPWIRAKRASNYSEYPFHDSLVERLSGTALDLDAYADKFAQCRQEMEQEVDKAFERNGYESHSGISVYLSPDTKELMFVIDHGGKYVRVAIVTDSGERKQLAYVPQQIEAVSVKFGQNVLRVFAKGAWQKKLYRTLFSRFLFDGEDSCVEQQMYHFAPLEKQSPPNAFSLLGFRNKIKRVAMTFMKCVQVDPVVGPISSDFRNPGLMHAKRFENGVSDEIQEIRLSVQMVGVPASGKCNVTIKNGGGRGMTCSNSAYYEVIYRWLGTLGFRAGHQEDWQMDLKQRAGHETEPKEYWKGLHRALNQDVLTKNFLIEKCGVRVYSFLEPFLSSPADAGYAKFWYDTHGQVYSVIENSERYVAADPEQMYDASPIENLDDIAMLELDREAVFKELRKALNGKKILRKEAKSLARGLFLMGTASGKAAAVSLFFPTTPDDMSYMLLASSRGKDALGYALLYPEGCWEKPLGEDYQMIPLHEVLELDENGHVTPVGGTDLAYEIKDYTDRRITGPPYKLWPHGFPNSRHWGHIRILLDFDAGAKHTLLHVTYGSGVNAPQHTFIHSEIAGLTKQTADHGWSKEFECFVRLIADCQKTGYFVQGDKSMTSALLRLGDILARFFAQDGQFYEEIPEHEGAKKRYRMKFAECGISGNLLGLLQS